MSYIRLKTASSREKRLDALSAYIGESNALLDEYEKGTVQQRIRTYSQSSNDDLVNALSVVARLKKSAVIVHGPQGCSSASAIAASGTGLLWASTNIDERDTIMGADEKLRATAATLFHRHKPEAIIIIATPSVAINNEDMQSVVDELTEELGIALVPVYVSGFSSKVALSGNDMAFHALLKYHTSEEIDITQPVLNLVSVNDHPADVREIVRLLDTINIPFQIFPDSAEPSVFVKARQATATIGFDYDSADYAGQWLSEISHVPYLFAPRPIGLTATREWLIKAAEPFGLTAAAKHLHAKESAECARNIASAELAGKRVYIEASPSSAFGLHDFVHELGGTTIGLSLTHFDRLHVPALKKLAIDFPSVPLHIGNNQTFETINIINKNKPDLILCSSKTAVHTAGIGISTVTIDNQPILGYSGFSSLARVIGRVLRHRGFTRLFTKSFTPYKEAWLSRSANWHIKQEVK